MGRSFFPCKYKLLKDCNGNCWNHFIVRNILVKSEFVCCAVFVVPFCFLVFNFLLMWVASFRTLCHFIVYSRQRTVCGMFCSCTQWVKGPACLSTKKGQTWISRKQASSSETRLVLLWGWIQPHFLSKAPNPPACTEPFPVPHTHLIILRFAPHFKVLGTGNISYYLCIALYNGPQSCLDPLVRLFVLGSKSILLIINLRHKFDSTLLVTQWIGNCLIARTISRPFVLKTKIV